MATNQAARGSTKAGGSNELLRTIDWRGAFWVASGVPALLLFSMGGIAGTTGKLAFLVWIISMIMGFLQSFTYAEIAGLFGSKSGGASVYGATAWLRYSKFVAPLSVWCNWFAWSPVLSLGCSIAAGYILNAWYPIPVFSETSPEVVAWLADPANAGKAAADAIAAVTAAGTPFIRTWELASFDIPGLATAHLNATFFIGVIMMLVIFAIQHRGILGTANVQKYIGILVIATLLAGPEKSHPVALNIEYAAEGFAHTNRPREGDGIHADVLFDLGQQLKRIANLSIHLVDKGDDRGIACSTDL